MPEPKTHALNRPGVERLLHYLPGFRGYLEKSYRRESDALQRQYLADRLDRAKRGLDAYTRSLVDGGHLDALAPCERLRARLDRLLGRIRGAMQGYSGMFDLVRIDEARLDKVYDHDLALLERVDRLAEGIEHLHAEVSAVPSLVQQIGEIEQAWDHREDLLKGLE
jgi:hypothetical protein